MDSLNNNDYISCGTSLEYRSDFSLAPLFVASRVGLEALSFRWTKLLLDIPTVDYLVITLVAPERDHGISRPFGVVGGKVSVRATKRDVEGTRNGYRRANKPISVFKVECLRQLP